ncbi:hypothetical protein F9L33_02085 [Amylibacter sp. SFDW26]|nr:hypothetical protein F9L33_02085 [Amylibacter sp. SFDW26]
MVNYLFSKLKSSYLERFIRSEDGAVTVEFVALTAAVVLIGAAAASSLTGRVNAAITGIGI